MNETPPNFAEWAILELFGHRRLAGYVTSVEIAGAGFLRVDTPSPLAPGDKPSSTHCFRPESVYGLHPTNEETARAVAKSADEAPVQRWELPPPAARRTDDDEWEDHDDGH